MTAELAVLNLAADQLAELPPSSAVLFCDSRAAFLTLAKDICRRLCNTYAQLGLPHVSPEHMLFPSANAATLRRAFYALLDFFGDAHLFTRL
ncbi:hypothetical protein MRX96_021226 [Rhipicephalus microplus]